jgi:glycosyltransferase involved in cell wall biosynthesis
VRALNIRGLSLFTIESKAFVSTDSSVDARAIPDASVVVPAYKAAAFIHEAVESVLAQTFSNREIIIVNGSPDTPELERALAPYRDHITYVVQENRGASNARNHGVRIARGEYVAFLDADDRWRSTYLETLIGALRADPDTDVMYANPRFWSREQTLLLNASGHPQRADVSLGARESRTRRPVPAHGRNHSCSNRATFLAVSPAAVARSRRLPSPWQYADLLETIDDHAHRRAAPQNTDHPHWDLSLAS